MNRFIYYIKNTTSIWNGFKVSGYFLALPQAKEALNTCQDHGKELGTGTIYEVTLGVVNPTERIVYKR